MNDRGDFYIGNKRISSNTGKEEVFDTPVPTITGEDVFIIGTETGVDVINPLDATISRGIKVEGGTQNNILSEFNGPILITEKLTSTSDEGIESNSLFLQGDTVVSRKYTVGLGTPTLAGNPGDVVYSANPSKGGTLGWTYSVESGWYPFGAISIDENSSQMIFDKVGVGTTTPGSNTFQVGNGTSIFAIDGTGGVGIGTTANEYKLNVIGDSFIDGNTTITGVFTATKFAGDGSGLTDLQNDSLWSGVLAGLGTGIYANDVLNVGIGTTVPLFPLDVGATGSGTTDVRVKNRASIEGQLDTTDITVTGIITTANHRLNSSSGEILTGIITATNIVVGTALSTTGGQVGFGTGSPRADADFEGSVKFKTYSENVETLDISSGVVVVDLSIGQTFELTVDEAVTEFTLLNPPTGSTAFSIKLTQDSTGYGVGIDTFKDNGGTPIPVYWPGGGVVPIPTTTASKTDIYSFKTFDGGSSLYGVVGGQNFA
tara:strand:- start:317 stop:1777 length:1461 start_codon:yes stop_codon:yes gene_type:complete